jgi:uncharacterized membrane protein (UPF0136 family)
VKNAGGLIGALRKDNTAILTVVRGVLIRGLAANTLTHVNAGGIIFALRKEKNAVKSGVRGVLVV